MRYKYVVILKRESEKATNVLSFLLCLISAVYFIWSAVSSSAGSPGLTYFHTGIALVLLLVIIINVLGKGSNRTRMRYRYILLIAALGWFASPLPWLAGLFLILAFLEHQTKRPLEIGFDDHQVVINTLIRRQYDWSAFTNIVLRDGLLTMDFSNNRLLQKEVLDDDEDEDDADEKEFNDYCQARLSEVAQK